MADFSLENVSPTTPGAMMVAYGMSLRDLRKRAAVLTERLGGKSHEVVFKERDSAALRVVDHYIELHRDGDGKLPDEVPLPAIAQFTAESEEHRTLAHAVYNAERVIINRDRREHSYAARIAVRRSYKARKNPEQLLRTSLKSFALRNSEAESSTMLEKVSQQIEDRVDRLRALAPAGQQLESHAAQEALDVAVRNTIAQVQAIRGATMTPHLGPER